MSSKNNPVDNNGAKRSPSRATTIVCALICLGSVLFAGFSYTVRGGTSKRVDRLRKEWKQATAERDRNQELIRQAKRSLDAQKALLGKSNSQTSQ